MSSTSNPVNAEALESSIYNPDLDRGSLLLYQIMEKTSHVETPALVTTPLLDPATVAPELREYVETFNNLSPSNPFQGVIVNPTICITDPIRDDLTGILSYMDGRYGSDGTWQNYRVEFEGDRDYLGGQLDLVTDHTNRLTSNLPSLAGLAQSALALAAVINLLSNPCLGLDGLLGSIMDSGKALLRDIKNQIASALSRARAWVDANIGPLIQDIRDSVEVARQAVGEFIAKAKAEILNFAKAMLAQVRQGLAELMASLPKDPCLRSLMGSVMTGAAAAALG